MMNGKSEIQFFERLLFENLGQESPIQHFEFVSGGCINNAVKIQSPQGKFFVKWNVQQLEGMFRAEAQGLEKLRQSGVIPIPQVLGYGQKEDRAYLLLEFIDSSIEAPNFWENFGQSLARLHRVKSPHFGLEFDNYIGSLAQKNQPNPNGIDFLIEQRLKAQAGLAWYEGKMPVEIYQKFEKLYDKLPDLIPNESASLLHGDLWSGNFMVNADGQVSLIDPAVYFGYREMELAFTQLFGGFSEVFYKAYKDEYPLEPGFEDRKDIYNLYPLLVHVNLFGSAYLAGVERTLKKYLG